MNASMMSYNSQGLVSQQDDNEHVVKVYQQYQRFEKRKIRKRAKYFRASEKAPFIQNNIKKGSNKEVSTESVQVVYLRDIHVTGISKDLFEEKLTKQKAKLKDQMVQQHVFSRLKIKNSLNLIFGDKIKKQEGFDSSEDEKSARMETDAIPQSEMEEIKEKEDSFGTDEDFDDDKPAANDPLQKSKEMLRTSDDNIQNRSQQNLDNSQDRDGKFKGKTPGSDQPTIKGKANENESLKKLKNDISKKIDNITKQDEKTKKAKMSSTKIMMRDIQELQQDFQVS